MEHTKPLGFWVSGKMKTDQKLIKTAAYGLIVSNN
jgi:hypothetical protein